MKTLDFIPVSAGDHLVHPEEFSDVDWDSSAMAVFTDFRRHNPQVVEQSFPAIEAEALMRKAHVRLMLVVDREDEFVGTISASDLGEQNIIQHLARGQDRRELCVSEVMRGRCDLLALDYEQVRCASIRDIVGTLQKNGQQHCLVIDSARHHIRGLISSSDIARRLHVPIEIARQNSFSEIFRAVRH